MDADGILQRLLGRRPDLRGGPAAHRSDPADPRQIMVLFVTGGVVLGALGVYSPLVEFAGSGATVPLVGFGWALSEGVRKAVEENGLFGAFTGGLTAGAAGTAAAIFFGFLAALVAKPGDKS